MNTRIAPATAPWSAAVARRFEKMPPILLFRVLARDDRLFERFMGGGLLDHGHLTLRQRELAILTVCARNHSDYEWGVHVGLLSERAGLSPAEVAATALPFDQASWIGEDALIVRLCDALQHSCDVNDALWSELRAVFDEMAVLELLMLVGKYREVCILTNALRLELEPGMPVIPVGPPATAQAAYS